MRMRRLAYPYVLWMAVFTVAPLMLVAFYALTAYDADGRLFFTLQGFRNVFATDNTVAFNLFGLADLLGFNLQVPIYINVLPNHWKLL